MTRRPIDSIIPGPLSWTLWLLLTVAVLPVSQAQGLWILAVAAPLASALGIQRTQRTGRVRLRQGTSAAVAGILALLIGATSFGAGTIGVYAVANWLIAVAILKCWQLGTGRDAAHVLIISGLLLVVGAMVSGQLTYAVALMVALFAAPAALLQWHLLTERHRLPRLGQPAPPRIAGQRWRPIAAVAGAFCLAVGFVVFATFPRLRTPLQPNLHTGAATVTGFSETSSLNDMGTLRQSDRVYMRVRLTTGGQNVGGASNQPYMRGMAYNYYNGHGWEDRGRRDLVVIPLARGSGYVTFRTFERGKVPVDEQEYWIESGRPPRLFCMPVPAAVGSDEISEVLWNPRDDTLVPPERLPAAVHYKIQSIPAYALPAARPLMPEDRSQGDRHATGEPPRPASTAPPASGEDPSPPSAAILDERPQEASGGDDDLPLAPQVRHRPGIYYPAVHQEVDALARTLAAEVTGTPLVGNAEPIWHERIVNRFNEYLSGPDFTYSLDAAGRSGGYGALETFLFKTRRGYCEYFATSLAVLCQSVGIPARYVTGFRGGQYNEVGGFYAVRDSDAHSWVEVWLANSGWRIFDPTPSAATPTTRSSLRARLASVLDYLQFQWSSWVVSYDILHRQALLGSFGDWMRKPSYRPERSWTGFVWTFQELIVGPETLSPLGKILYWLGLLGVLGLSGYLLVQLVRALLQWNRRRRRARAARNTGIRYYQRVVMSLTRHGYVRQPAETPREFAIRVEKALPQCAGLLAEMIEHYYAARHGQASPTNGQAVSRRLLDRLETRTIPTDRGRAATVRER